MIFEKHTIGMGDRFGHQGKAQLQAVIDAKARGADIAPVWNKSHREHKTVHTEPMSLRKEADDAVKALGWAGSYYIDADHIGLKNVDVFLEASNFYTLDVADSIGRIPDSGELDAFVRKYGKYAGELAIPGIEEKLAITTDQIESIGKKYLSAIKEAGRIYRHIEKAKGYGRFITEISMDETREPQTPVEMLFILAAISGEGIPAQTLAPRFSGRFNKGVDYAGDVARFSKEFEDDLAVIRFAVREFSLPGDLKLSVHSGSDKFSIYGSIRRAIKKYGTGIHLKTAGTTWLEECIGLAEAGDDGLEIAKNIYKSALERFDELCAPYAEVIDIDSSRLPSADAVSLWSGKGFADALRHEPACPSFNPDFRQLLHVGYKVASEMGSAFHDALERHADIIGNNVHHNLFFRHLKPLFLD